MDKRTIILLLVMAALAVGSAVPYCSDRLADRRPKSEARDESEPAKTQSSSSDAPIGIPKKKAPSPFTPSADAGESERIQQGRDIMVEHCYGTCHSGTVVLEAHKPAGHWASTVDRMIRHGMQIEPQDRELLIDFLSTLP